MKKVQSNVFSPSLLQLVLKPYHFAVFSIKLVTPTWEGTFAVEVIIITQV